MHSLTLDSIEDLEHSNFDSNSMKLSSSNVSGGSIRTDTRGSIGDTGGSICTDTGGSISAGTGGSVGPGTGVSVGTDTGGSVGNSRECRLGGSCCSWILALSLA